MLDKEEKMNVKELDNVAGGMPANYDGTRYCYNCGAKYYVPWGNPTFHHIDWGLCATCATSSAFKRGFRHFAHTVFKHKYK